MEKVKDLGFFISKYRAVFGEVAYDDKSGSWYIKAISDKQSNSKTTLTQNFNGWPNLEAGTIYSLSAICNEGGKLGIESLFSDEELTLLKSIYIANASGRIDSYFLDMSAQKLQESIVRRIVIAQKIALIESLKNEVNYNRAMQESTNAQIGKLCQILNLTDEGTFE